MSSLFSCGAMTPQARRSRRAGNASDRPRATIQRPASSGGMRRGASSASRLCDLADKCENLTTGSSGLPSIGSRAPLSPLAVNSPPTCTPTDETVCPPPNTGEITTPFRQRSGCAMATGYHAGPSTSLQLTEPARCAQGRPDVFTLDSHKSAHPTPPQAPIPPRTPMAPPPAPPPAPLRHSGQIVQTPKAQLLRGAEPVRVPQGHVVSGVKVCAACRARLCAEGSGACFFAFDRSFCTEVCQQRFIDMARAKAASRRQRE